MKICVGWVGGGEVEYVGVFCDMCVFYVYLWEIDLFCLGVGTLRVCI